MLASGGDLDAMMDVIPNGGLFLEALYRLTDEMVVSETGTWFRTVVVSAALAAGPLIKSDPNFSALWGDGDDQRARHLLDVLVLSVGVGTMRDKSDIVDFQAWLSESGTVERFGSGDDYVRWFLGSLMSLHDADTVGIREIGFTYLAICESLGEELQLPTIDIPNKTFTELSADSGRVSELLELHDPTFLLGFGLSSKALFAAYLTSVSESGMADRTITR